MLTVSHTRICKCSMQSIYRLTPEMFGWGTLQHQHRLVVVIVTSTSTSTTTATIIIIIVVVVVSFLLFFPIPPSDHHQ